MSGLPPFARAGEGFVEIFVRLTPKGGRDQIDGAGTLSDGRAVLLARVRSAPEKGAANAALLALIAKTAGVPKSAVTLIAGDTQRLKRIRVDGEVGVLAGRLSGFR